MGRAVIYAVLFFLFARAMGRFWTGLTQGMAGRPSGAGGRSVPQRGVQMARDPVCGTFVVPERAVSIAVGQHMIHFCSAACRDKYQKRTA